MSMRIDIVKETCGFMRGRCEAVEITNEIESKKVFVYRGDAALTAFWTGDMAFSIECRSCIKSKIETKSDNFGYVTITYKI